jgi:hypothetical protein
VQNTGFVASFSRIGPAAAGPKGYTVGRGPHTKVLVPPAQASPPPSLTLGSLGDIQERHRAAHGRLPNSCFKLRGDRGKKMQKAQEDLSSP